MIEIYICQVSRTIRYTEDQVCDTIGLSVVENCWTTKACAMVRSQVILYNIRKLELIVEQKRLQEDGELVSLSALTD